MSVKFKVCKKSIASAQTKQQVAMALMRMHGTNYKLGEYISGSDWAELVDLIAEKIGGVE